MIHRVPLTAPVRGASAAVRQLATQPGTHRRVIVSGIQPTGVPHLGNYLGALSNWLELQRSAGPDDELYFFTAGLHAITVPQKPAQLHDDRRNLFAILIAIGLDPQRCTIFHQDQVAEHAELGWLLGCLVPFGRLERMTTWKSKLATIGAEASDTSLQLGLFAYPVLQAADILLYRATHVPVGEDQTQHLELTRDIAHTFNRTTKSNFFARPECLTSPAKRILSLRNPEQKMSKSAPDVNSRILLTDTPQEVNTKIKRAVTDSDTSVSYDPEGRPGLSNLISILASLGGGVLHNDIRSWGADPHEIAAVLDSSTGGMSGVKKVLAESINETLAPIQHEYTRIIAEPGYLDALEELGRNKASAKARDTLTQVRRMLGLQV